MHAWQSCLEKMMIHMHMYHHEVGRRYRAGGSWGVVPVSFYLISAQGERAVLDGRQEIGPLSLAYFHHILASKSGAWIF